MPEALANQLPALQIVLALIAAPLAAVAGRRGGWLVAMVASVITFAIAATLLASVLDGTVIAYHMGGWAPPLGIEYRVDALNAFVLVIISGVAALTLPYARTSIAAEVAEERHGLFYAAFLLCLAGLMGVAITADAFNLFVFLEISSLSSYALIAAGAERDRRALTAAYNYLVMGTIGATYFVIGLGFLYMLTGTLNMADLAQRLLDLGDNRTLRMGFAFILIGLALKLAMFPLHLWLPNAYARAPSAVTVFISATATKVIVYALLRFLFAVFAFDFAFQGQVLRLVVLPLALVGMVVASTVALFQHDLKRMLAYSSVAQIGYMLLGISILSHGGLMASVIHLFNHAVAKAALFMAAGSFFLRTGTTSLRDLSGIGRDMPWTTAAFVAGGLSIIGVPLTVGFVSKWYLVEAVIAEGWWPVVFLVVGTSLIALGYIWRVVEVAYLREAPEGVVRKEAPLSMLIPTWGFVGLSLYFGINAELTSAAASRAANALIGASNLFWQ
ncbi:MAG: monovalent cation/H+ antiporter subunit D family protein [Parvibaculum sp.]|uniref:monovalent cation/H+ antiporter subunit D family protein n=1 Tax=Parvibaculum sp. TaxID=2024848 RepID=UPI003C78A5A5